MSVTRCKSETTSTEFVMWQKRIQDEANDFHRWDDYLARVCYEIYLLRKSFSGGKVELTPEDYKMKFSVKLDKPVEEGDETPPQGQDLKTGILAAFGMSPDGERVKPLPTKHPNLRTR